MYDLFTSGVLIDFALAVIAVEAVVLVALARKGSRRLRPLDVLGQLSAGALLLLAVRSVVVHADYRWTLALLAGSFPAHVFDLSRRARTTA